MRPGLRLGQFIKWSQRGDPDDILLEIIAARCLGIEYGDPGPKLPEGTCKECWGERKVWYGNCWGYKHIKPGPKPNPHSILKCAHECHDNEMYEA